MARAILTGIKRYLAKNPPLARPTVAVNEEPRVPQPSPGARNNPI